MARTVVGEAVVVRERYIWPDAQLNFWTIIMLVTAGTILGINAVFMQQQAQLRQPTPWLFPYSVTVGSLTIAFILIELILVMQQRLMPGVMMLLSFILLVLFVTGIIATAIQLFGGHNVSNLCQTYVANEKVTGPSTNTLAWLEQNSICQSWDAAFAFWIVGTVFLVWMMVMASQVSQNLYE